MKNRLLSTSFLSAIGVLIYVSLIAILGFNGPKIFGAKDNILMPIFALLLFVTSASITGLIVLGKPVNLYLGGQKKEAFTLLFYTICWMVIFLLLVALILIGLK